jgi:hypothetical protein
VAALRLDGGGDPVYLIVERLGVAGRVPPPMRGGAGYYARLPEEQLYLPVGRRVAPLLSRRGLVDALGLGRDHLTLLDAGPDGKVLVTRVPRAALGLVPEMVDYLAGEAATDVQALLGVPRFDFDLTAAELGAAPADSEEKPGFWQRLFGRSR